MEKKKEKKGDMCERRHFRFAASFLFPPSFPPQLRQREKKASPRLRIYAIYLLYIAAWLCT